MSMKFTQLRTHWTADDAHLILSFVDELRDTLWAAYGAEIIEQRQKENPGADLDGQPIPWERDDHLEF